MKTSPHTSSFGRLRSANQTRRCFSSTSGPTVALSTTDHAQGLNRLPGAWKSLAISAACAMGLVLVVGPLVGAEAMARTGEVYVDNKTDEKVDFYITKYIDGNGNEHKPKLTWKFEPRERDYLLDGGKRIQASKVHFTFKSKHGTTSWNSDYFDDDGDLYIVINPADLTPKKDTKSGQVYVANKTDEEVVFLISKYLDANGKEHKVTDSWTFAPQEKDYLLLDGKRFTASKVHFSFKSKHGTTYWNSTFVDEDGDLYITINPDELIPKKGTGTKSGEIFVANNTNRTVEFRITKYFDENGKQKSTDTYWSFEPNEKAYILDNDKRIRASKVHFTFKTSKGTTNWNSEFFDDDGDLLIEINNKDLK